MPIKRITRYKSQTFQSKGPTTVSSSQTCQKPRGCVHRGEFVGKADCGCSGAPKIYQCNAIYNQLCTNSTINSTTFPIISDGGKTLYESVTTSEVIRCGPKTCTSYMEERTDEEQQNMDGG